ncbi:FGGY-family carbohydrate kinase [Ureibacillus sp. GCM10028918]|uniref:FGGY-family carbohydrate kinase n=1 Tax=Ureibacillus sp. GCM10028918 TaxID=3273429 RepID=UPI003615FEFC
MEHYIGIDIGTYESKGVLVNQLGKILHQHNVPHTLTIPRSGWAEHEPLTVWWDGSKEIIKEIVRYCYDNKIDPVEIKCIGLSSIAPSIVPIDKQGKPLRNGILYGIDTRTTKQIKILNEKLSEAYILKHAKQALTTQAGGPKILWIKENEPEIYAQTESFLSGAGFVIHKLTGKKVIDHYTAASFAPLYDFSNYSWSEEFAEHITDTNKLPELYWANEIVGPLNPRIAEELGLASDTKILAGSTDALSEAISSGSVEIGDLMLMYGSSTFFILNINEMTTSDKMWPNLHAVPGIYSLTGGTSTAGSLMRWFIDQFDDLALTTDERYQSNMKAATQSEVGANGVICLPYFSGERTPLNNPEAKGIFWGLTLKHTKADLYRAVLEGVAYTIRQNIEYMNDLGFDIKRIISIGGGTKNELLIQIVSDVCGIKQVVTENKVGASYGNAFLCHLALNKEADLHGVANWLEIKEVIEPNSYNYQKYTEYYKKFKLIYEQTKNLM